MKEPVIVRDGWYNAEYQCPDCWWGITIAASYRLTNKSLHERNREQYEAHRLVVHPDPETVKAR